MKINQRVSIVVLCLTACAVLLGCNPFAAKSRSPLLEYLSYIPDEPEYREYVVYGDIENWYSAWGIPRPDSFEEANHSEYHDELLYIMPSQTTPPYQLVQYQYQEDEIDYYGFNLYSMDRHFQAGIGKQLTLIDLQESQLVEPALREYGYESSSLALGTLYSYGEDNEIHPDAPNLAGKFPLFNRIYVDADRLILARATDMVESALDASSGKTASLADDRVFQAVAAALEDPALKKLGKMVGVLLLDLEELNKDPEFDKAAFATFQDDEEAYLVLLLVMPQGEDAEVAARLVGERLKSYVSKNRGPLDEFWSYHESFDMKKEGLPVAVVVMRAEVSGYNVAFEAFEKKYVVVMDWFRLVGAYDLQFLEATP